MPEPRTVDPVANVGRPLPKERMARPHRYFPFDVLSPTGVFNMDSWFDTMMPDLKEKLKKAQPRSMNPPYPWGQHFYHQLIQERLVQQGVAGDFCELGVGLGGMSLFLGMVAKELGRKHLAVDSFVGLPPLNNTFDNAYFKEGDYENDASKGVGIVERLSKDLEDFEIQDVVTIRKGFFKDVNFEGWQFAFAHFDSDLYDSVMDSFKQVYHRVVDGGVICVDDFFHHAQGPARAVSDFFRLEGLGHPLIYPVPPYGIAIVKGQFVGPVEPYRHINRSLDGNFYSFEVMRSSAAFRSAVLSSRVRIQDHMAELRGVPVTPEIEAALAALQRSLDLCTDFEVFLSYSIHPRHQSGSDIHRFLLALEDFWDYTQSKQIAWGIMESREKIKI
mmetsp:Transcript_52605/g.115369  ORF Transcript_52605/g.115369 Transcript_52605/m.115369 type:complete len:388 (+) Transcript_52605:13-1176(+)